MKSFAFTFVLLLFGLGAVAQTVESSAIYIVRPKNYMGRWVKMKLDVNGKTVVLPRNSYIELSVTTDEIIIRATSKRLAKFSTPVRSSIQEARYFMAYFSVLNVKGWPKDVVVIQPVCKECYDERIRGCSEITHQTK